MLSGGSRDNNKDKPNLYVYSLGLLFFRRARMILTAHDFNVRFGIPRKETDMVAVWGRKRTYKRGKFVAQKRNVPLVTIEDSFMRSIRTGRQGAPSIGVVMDKSGIFFDATQSNDLHELIKVSAGLTGSALDQAKEAMLLLKEKHLSKYNAFELDDPQLPSDYVLVIDQTVGDASIRLGGAHSNTFQTMLETAISENPNVTILIKTHPETSAGKRQGHFKGGKNQGVVQTYDKAISPWTLFSRARAVYCVTSQLGLEAIFAGHRPVIFGLPFYSGWGLSDDRHSEQSQKGWRTPEQIFWAAYQKYTFYYDPFFKRKTNFHSAADIIEAQSQNWRDGSKGAVFYGMRLWKRGFFRRFLSIAKMKTKFTNRADTAIEMAASTGATLYRWGLNGDRDFEGKARENNIKLVNVEDGFIRSQGLGAQLIAPVSLVFDDVGIYYDPSRSSVLENMINASNKISQRGIERAKNLIKNYVDAGLSKYNLNAPHPEINSNQNQRKILVVGQVEDDASIKLGTDQISTNQALLWAVRQKFPKDFIVYKPHPDVVAGLRAGDVGTETLRATTDMVIKSGNVSHLISITDTVCTMTSLTGFEALLQKKQVICYGVPFYAGWGLTTDMVETPDRRIATPKLEQLAHSVLIDYPRYWDPITGDACPVEVIVERFKNRQFAKKQLLANRTLSKLQGIFASYAHLWR